MKTRTLTNKRWLPLAIVPLFSVAVLSGCSSDDDDTGGTPPVVETNADGTPVSFLEADTLNDNTDLVDVNADGIDDRDLNQDGLDDRDIDGNGVADEYQTPVDPSVLATDSNANFVDDSYEASITGGADANGDGIDDASAALLAGGGTSTTGETGGETTGGETGGETTGGSTGGETGGETGGGTTGGSTGGSQPTGSIDGITVGGSSAEVNLTFDGSRITGSVEAADAVEVALFSGIAASDGTVQRVRDLNGSGPTFFMPNPLSDQENAQVIENFLSGSLYLQVTTNSGQVIRSDQLLPPGGTVSPIYTALELETGSDYNSNGAAFLHVNSVTGQYSVVATVNIDVSDLDSEGNTISVAAAHIHAGSAAGDIILPLGMDSSTTFSATGTFSDADLATIQQNNGWFNVHLNDGTTPGASLLTGQIVFSQ